MTEKATISNFVKLEPSLPTRLARKMEYFVIDFTLPDGKYFLDRFFIRHEVHVEYPQGGEYHHPDFGREWA